MAKKKQAMRAAGSERVLNVQADPPDIRDRMYEPALVPLRPELKTIDKKLVLDQGTEGACTGFGLAAVINLQKVARGHTDFRASPRMLYEMARHHDEWPGEAYAGSSCRGAIRGWHNMGVCEEKSWKYKPNDTLGGLTVERAMNARSTTLGAYYRLRPEITDYHAAMNEAGALYVSANVHEGWQKPQAGAGKMARIKHSPIRTGGHAFAIVGYDSTGFIVQNSWASNWGSDGFAIWSYEDWLENVMDGWVFRLALPTPQIFGFEARHQPASEAEAEKRPPAKRAQIAGHFVHFDDGHYKSKGDLWSSSEDVKGTADRLAASSSYDHLLIYAHGGLNTPKASARRIRALKEGFKRNRIYPFHIMYDTGLAEEISDVIKRALGMAEERAAGFTDWTDWLIEQAVRKPVTPLWEEMKRDAKEPFIPRPDGAPGDGMDAIAAFAGAIGNSKPIHLAGHSTGGVLLGHLMGALEAAGTQSVESCSLMAPACTIDFFKASYAPRLGARGAGLRLKKLNVYNLDDKREKKDQVAFAYRKSLLYLVSRALERSDKKPLLGMQRYSKNLKGANLKFMYSDGRSGTVTRSLTHGGFDNDVYTLNHIMRTILGKPASKPFTEEELKGY